MKFSKQVKTPLLPEVKKVIDNVQLDLTPRRYRTNIKKWLLPVVDLSDFYVYPTNGITEGLNWWAGTSSYNIWREIGEYEWVDHKTSGMYPTTTYQSTPSAIDGNFRNSLADGPVALDLAYVGTTAVRQIELTDNVHTVFYGLSKPFGINGIRTGWLFTRKRDDKLHNLIYNNNYYNYYSTAVAESIIENFSIDFIHKKFYNKQKEICEQFKLTPSDSVFLATTTDEEYKDYVRKDVARLCLAEYYIDE
jgi:hypothetical protein